MDYGEPVSPECSGKPETSKKARATCTLIGVATMFSKGNLAPRAQVLRNGDCANQQTGIMRGDMASWLGGNYKHETYMHY